MASLYSAQELRAYIDSVRTAAMSEAWSQRYHIEYVDDARYGGNLRNATFSDEMLAELDPEYIPAFEGLRAFWQFHYRASQLEDYLDCGIANRTFSIEDILTSLGGYLHIMPDAGTHVFGVLSKSDVGRPYLLDTDGRRYICEDLSIDDGCVGMQALLVAGNTYRPIYRGAIDVAIECGAGWITCSADGYQRFIVHGNRSAHELTEALDLGVSDIRDDSLIWNIQEIEPDNFPYRSDIRKRVAAALEEFRSGDDPVVALEMPMPAPYSYGAPTLRDSWGELLASGASIRQIRRSELGITQQDAGPQLLTAC